MPIKLFLTATALVTAVIGTILLLVPSFIANFFLPSAAHGTDIFIRFLGSTLIGFTYLNWATTRYEHLAAMRATLIGNFSTLSIALVISIVGVLDHTLKITGVFIILLHLVFAVGFGSYLYKLRQK